MFQEIKLTINEMKYVAHLTAETGLTVICALGSFCNNEWHRAVHVTKADLTRLGFSAAVPVTSICITGENCTP